VDIDLMKDIGATAVRASHYQHSDSFYSGCDRAGIVVWAEIPFVNEALATPEFLENARQQMRELIRQNFNHPSICFWGVGNETRGPDDAVISALAEEVRAEDPGRLSTYASNQAAADKARLGMSEFGAGASVTQHAENPARPETKGPFHPEEYQSYYHEVYWSAFKARPYLWAKFIWCLHDFASDGRNEGDHPGRNDKGLVTYDRKIKKDAYFFYKANWSGEPVLHITSSRFSSRTDPITDVKIYSNAAEVTLEVDGVSQGTRSDQDATRVFVWRGVRLSPGENRVTARAHFGPVVTSDSCAWTLGTR
jgi:beta-galactosidase